MNWIKNIVTGLIETYHTKNVYELIDALGITIIRKNSSKKARFLRTQLGDEFIFLNNNLDEHEEKYILAHELGHAILHTDLSCEYIYFSYTSSGKLEFQANYFATELLVGNIDKEFIQNKSLDELSACFGVPKQMLEYKFSKDN